jgi:hypothetical protein
MKKTVKEKRGITLVALVITIIVLLILAGITINLTVGQGGILTTAQQAGKNYVASEKTELADIDDLYYEPDWLLYGTLEVGSYVNYPVDYNNVGSTVDGEYYIAEDEYAGKWRILDLGDYDEETKTYSNVRIVSAGVPLTYYHGTSTSNILLRNIFDIQIDDTNVNSFCLCGFKNSNNEVVDSIDAVKELFNNTFTAKNGDEPVVQAMNWEDLNKGNGDVAVGYGGSVTGNDLLAIPSKKSGYYATYWLNFAVSQSANVYIHQARLFADR